MQNLVVLIDTNILLNYITNREDKYLSESIKIVELCASGKLNGYIAFHALSTLWYVLRKRNDKERRENLRDENRMTAIERWGMFEISLSGKKDGNPFTDYNIVCVFCHEQESVTVEGFYDGGGFNAFGSCPLMKENTVTKLAEPSPIR